MGLLVSTMMILGLVIISDLMVLPVLTGEASQRQSAFQGSFLEYRGDSGGGEGGGFGADVGEYGSDGDRGKAGASDKEGVLEMMMQATAAAAGRNGSTRMHEKDFQPLLDLLPTSPSIYVEKEVDQPICLYGGVLTSQGCVCGKRTKGYRCEELVVPEEELEKEGTMCGPGCWSVYVWYPTIHFKFDPIPKEDKRMWNKLKTVLAWKEGGVLRKVPDAEAKGLMPVDSAVEEWLLGLGPFTHVDRKMMSLWAWFRAQLHPIEEKHKARLLIENERKSKDRAKICYGLIIHKDAPQFEAFWRVMYDRQNFYIIHVDRQAEKGFREELEAIIEATKFEGGGSVWDKVELVPHEDSVRALWGDVTLVYLEMVMWVRAFLRIDWEWDYWINLSTADIPLKRPVEIEKMLGARIPGSFLSSHSNDGEFRQIHFVPEREKEGEVIVFNPIQAEMPSGRWRVRNKQIKIWGCTQWHMLHWTMAYEFATNPKVHGLLLSLKDTGIPDESFFASAAMWLKNTAEERGSVEVPIVGGDMKYRNEGLRRDLSQPGEYEALQGMSTGNWVVWARKAYTAFITCSYTNGLLGLKNDCSKYEGLVWEEDNQR